MKYTRQRETAEIEAEIARVRREMDETLSAIESRLTTEHLIDQAIAYTRQSGAREFASNLGTSVKQNPLSVTLVGIGLAWLMLSGRHAAPPSDEAHGMAGGTERARASIKEGAVAAAQTVSQTVRGAAQKWTEAGASIRYRSRQAVDATRVRAERARRGFGSILNEQPLVLGAIGVAIGAAIAAAAPQTRAEDEWIGEAGDWLTDELKRSWEERRESLRETADPSRAPAEDRPEHVAAPSPPSPQQPVAAGSGAREP